MFVYNVRVMAVLFHSVPFKWTFVDMFDHGWGGFDLFLLSLFCIFHDRMKRGFVNCTIIHHVTFILQIDSE